MIGEAVHQLPAAAFDDLAVGLPDPATLDLLRRGQLSRRLISLRSAADLARTRVPRLWRDTGAEQTWALFAAADRADRAALHETLMHPPVGALLGSVLRTLDSPAAPPDAEAVLVRLARLGVAAALRAGVPLRTELPMADGRLALPTWGVAVFPPDIRTVRLVGREISAPGTGIRMRIHDGPSADPPPGTPGWLAVRRLTIGPPAGAPQLRILLEDGDPDRDVYSCPAAPRLTADQAASWEATLRRGWDVLCEHYPERAALCAELCTCIVPLAPPRWRASAASRELFGAVAFSATDDPVLVAEALVHEVSHVCLAALTDLVDLHDAGYPQLYRVGWRSDPRPLGAVLQGVYAHIHVVDFWERHRRFASPSQAPRAEARYRRLHGQVLAALGLLEDCPGLTRLGRRLYERMAAVAATWPAPLRPALVPSGTPGDSRRLGDRPKTSSDAQARPGIPGGQGRNG